MVHHISLHPRQWGLGKGKMLVLTVRQSEGQPPVGFGRPWPSSPNLQTLQQLLTASIWRLRHHAAENLRSLASGSGSTASCSGTIPKDTRARHFRFPVQYRAEPVGAARTAQPSCFYRVSLGFVRAEQGCLRAGAFFCLFPVSRSLHSGG